MKPYPSSDLLDRVIREIPTPFHLYDERMIRENARKLRAAFSWNAGFKEYFAVKANPNPAILNILKEEGCGVDCASYTELMLAEACGFAGDEIMFSSNVTPAAEYRYARSLNANINLDDITHIDFLRKNGGLPPFVCLRYNPGGDFSLGNAVMGNPGDAKFGMTHSQIFDAVKTLMGYGVERFGLHAFLVSNATDTAYYPTMAGMLMRVAAELYDAFGARVEMINLSGGIGIPYEPSGQPADITAIGEGVREAYESIIAARGLAPVRIVSELGRYMTGPAGCLVAKVLHQKRTHKHYIGLDASAVDLMRPAMYGAYHHITVPAKAHLPCEHKYDVTGALCENNDKFAVDRFLPRIEIGDIVVIHDTGAHGHSMGYNYNGKLRSAEVLLREDGGYALIRRRETPKDYFATLDILNVMDDVVEKRGEG